MPLRFAFVDHLLHVNPPESPTLECKTKIRNVNEFLPALQPPFGEFTEMMFSLAAGRLRDMPVPGGGIYPCFSRQCELE